jgi:hypothetical protein
MPVDDRDQSRPTGPWSPPPPRATSATAQMQAPRWRLSGSAIIFMLLLLGVGIRAFKDLSQPDAWAYWKDQYFAPSLTASVIAKADFDGSGRGRPALAIHGTIGPAAASWLRTELDQAHLAPGDTVLLASPGGDLGQAIIMGEIIRAHGLATAVGTADSSGRVRSAYCASACVLVYAGGKPRLGVEGSLLGVHRFVTVSPVSDPVADTQRTTGMVLGYMTKMGVSSSVVEAMSETREIRWLAPKDALAMNLVTDPLRKP